MDKLPNSLHKILLYFGLILVQIIGSLFFLIRYKNEFIRNEYKYLMSEGKREFAVLTKFEQVEKNYQKKYLYTYLIPDITGKLYEVIEEVDEKLKLKLRLGDTVVVRIHSMTIFNKSYTLYRMEGNKSKFYNLDYIENFVKTALLFSVFVFGLGFVLSLINHFKSNVS